MPDEGVGGGGALVDDGVVRLRPLSVADLGAHLAGCDEEIVLRLGGGVAPTAPVVRGWLAGNARAWAEGGAVVDLGVEDVATGALAGTVGIQRGLAYLGPGQVNLAFALYPGFRGRGHATRAVRLAMRLAAERGPVSEFVIRASPDHVDSLAVAERAGFEPAGRTDDEHGELVWWRRPAG